MEMIAERKLVYLTVDCAELAWQMTKIIEDILESPDSKQLVEKGVKLPVLIDLDMSYSVANFSLGAHRSRLRTADFDHLVNTIRNTEHLQLRGILGYEAHVAGLPDMPPSSSLLGSVFVRFMKYLFFKECKRIRTDVLRRLKPHQIQLDLFNGSGSGNFKEALTDLTLTEITVGSAFLQGHIFDNFTANECYPAICFALQVDKIRQG